MVAHVRVPSEDEHPYFVLFGDVGYDIGRHTDVVIVRRADLGPATVSDLASALLPNDDVEELYFTDDDSDDYDEDASPVLPVRFDLVDPRLHVRVQVRPPSWLYDDDEEDGAAIRRLVGPVLDAAEADFHTCDVTTYYPAAAISFTPRRQTMLLSEALRLGEAIGALIEATRGGPVTMPTMAGLVRAGRLEALIGQPESLWFDAKVTHYDLGADAGKLSLAESVARFCNSADGGLIVVGLGTATRNGIEYVDKLRPVPVKDGLPGRYRQILDSWIYPRVRGLRVDAVEAIRGGHYILIEVPPQPGYSQPYLVHGAVVGEKFHGEFISVVERRDFDSEPIRMATVHAWIAAGRAFLERRDLPASDANAGPEDSPYQEPT